MACSSQEEVELGFAEDPEDYSKLTSPYFPSKIGGKPAWLDLHLPTPEHLFCKKCNNPRVFLLQVYAPIDHLTHCYHRTLYVFCCKEPSCHSRNNTEPFLVLRCNLPKVNGKISGVADKGVENKDDRSTMITQSDSTLLAATSTLHSSSDVVLNNCDDTSNKDLVQDQEGLERNLNQLPPLCIVCGCGGPKRCAKCHSVNYCSWEHQVIHWKAGHKKQCGDKEQSTTSDSANGGILFKEFEIVTETEPPITVTPEKSEEERLKDYHKFLEQHSKNSGSADMDKMCLDEVGKGARKDKQFMTFKKRVAVEPDQNSLLLQLTALQYGKGGIVQTDCSDRVFNCCQVIRYQRGGAPLWISSENLPNQIPGCERCGSKRVFEFQVMPQLLYYLKLDSMEGASIDWGILAVYSCERSCTGGQTTGAAAYQHEFLWKQDPSTY